MWTAKEHHLRHKHSVNSTEHVASAPYRIALTAGLQLSRFTLCPLLLLLQLLGSAEGLSFICPHLLTSAHVHVPVRETARLLFRRTLNHTEPFQIQT